MARHKAETSDLIRTLTLEIKALNDTVTVKDDKILRLKAVVKELQVRGYTCLWSPWVYVV